MSADGTWNTTMNTPMGAQNGSLTLTTNGAELSGKMSSPQGEMAIENGTIDGANLAWKAAITSPMPMTLEFTATVDGDAITVTVKLGAFGEAEFSGTRAG
ncbi:MAG: hypothetical protein CBC52_004195 [Gammaproteobacteria bacterium TMED92]|nr:MAG: hypothetical protein CBC52_004195 [Gammaproteobacteria bacterium TMED92]